MSTYSFIDVSASLTGPTGSIDLGYGSANSEEGITVVMAEAKNTMTVGADGEVMHSLHAGKSGMLWSSFFGHADQLSLLHIFEPTRRNGISFAGFCLKKKTIS
ncbi:phage protein, partial [Klebsiella pneumoniae]|uniref:phage protein n=12 Tax=Klebsiella pneumoniae TaxID=573 RepID=UPI00211A6E63